MSNWLQDMSWSEAKENIKTGKGVAIIPIGSTEQHGYHLPLGTDSYVAITLAEAASEQTGAIISPPIWFGWSPHHMVLPGTITVDTDTLINLTYNVIKSLSQHGVNKFVIINGHRVVNIPWMQIAAERAQSSLDVQVRIFDPAYMSKEIVHELGFGYVGHAEEIETSHMMYSYPKLVHLEKAVDNPPHVEELYSPDPTYTMDTLCYVPSTVKHALRNAEIAGGTGGEPSKSDAEKGRIYHEHLVKNLVKVIKSLQS